jgi:hypothetical protein
MDRRKQVCDPCDEEMASAQMMEIDGSESAGLRRAAAGF